MNAVECKLDQRTVGGESRRPHSASSTTSFDSNGDLGRNNQPQRITDKNTNAQKDSKSVAKSNRVQRTTSMPVMPLATATAGHLSDISERSNEPSRMTTHEQHEQQSIQQRNHSKHVTIESEATTPETVSPSGPPRKVSIAPEALALPSSSSVGINRVPTPGAPSSTKQKQDHSKAKMTESRGSKDNLLHDDQG